MYVYSTWGFVVWSAMETLPFWYEYIHMMFRCECGEEMHYFDWVNARIQCGACKRRYSLRFNTRVVKLAEVTELKRKK